MSSTAICCSVVSALTPASELNSALVLSEFRMLPPASQSIGSQCQTVSSLPSAGISQPYCPLAGSVSLGGGGTEVVPRPLRRRRCDTGVGEQLLVVDDREVVHQGGHADDLVADGRGVALRLVEVVPLPVGLRHLLGHVDQRGDLGDVRCPRPEHVGDVGCAVAAHRRQNLLQHKVVGGVQLGHLHIGVILVVLVDKALEGLALGVLVAVPHLDFGRAGRTIRCHPRHRTRRGRAQGRRSVRCTTYVESR